MQSASHTIDHGHAIRSFMDSQAHLGHLFTFVKRTVPSLRIPKTRPYMRSLAAVIWLSPRDAFATRLYNNGRGPGVFDRSDCKTGGRAKPAGVDLRKIYDLFQLIVDERDTPGTTNAFDMF